MSASLGTASRLRIAFAADFHAGPTTSEQVFDRAAQLLADAGADLLLLGGDFVSLRADDARRLIRLLAQIPAPLGRFAVLGNHDYWTDAPAIVAQLRSVGIRVLTNDHLRLPAPFQNVSVCGLDDHTSGEPDAAAAFADVAPVRIVLMHAPSGLLDIGDRRFAVALCGHTHGGQIALWNGRPLIVAHGRLSRRYSAGRFVLEDGRVLLVSRGLGCSLLPVRVNAPAAVLICTLAGDVDTGSNPGGFDEKTKMLGLRTGVTFSPHRRRARSSIVPCCSTIPVTASHTAAGIRSRASTAAGAACARV